MEDKLFTWTDELSKRMLDMRFANDWLFKKKKQPWKEFFKILKEHDFPEEMTINHVRKKWSYTYDTYKIAKKERNKEWKYYKMFEKHYGKAKVLDKYESWNDEWRLKLITCICETKALKMDYHDMWRTIERAMRSQALPEDCCIQDIKGLWRHIRMTFNRKHRMKSKKGDSDWRLYDTMLEYYNKYDPKFLETLETDIYKYDDRQNKRSHLYYKTQNLEEGEYEFNWSKDITESFIQLRLQNDLMFRSKKWAWSELLAIMTEEHGFPKLLTSREISRKWAATFSEYQKAKATNNKSWVYYNLFELYLGEGSLSLNPLVGWQEEWVLNLISARIDLNHLFKVTHKEYNVGWREVEKKLRTIGLPLEHSLLDLTEIWTHLEKTYKWKRKFADKGMLTEQWPYFEAMAQYEAIRVRPAPKQKQEPDHDHDNYDCNDNDDDYEDDIKLFDLKQKLDLQVKPKYEYLGANQCRSCSNEEGCVNIFEQTDDEGHNLAFKLKIIGDVQVEPADNLPAQICLNCLRELESAYKFRCKCQEVDKDFRILKTESQNIKVEIQVDDTNEHNLDKTKDEHDRTDAEDLDHNFNDYHSDVEVKAKKPRIKREPAKFRRKKRKIRKEKYEYLKICEVCGKHTRNLMSHLDMHTSGKSYSCEVCDKKFKFKSGLLIHKAVHDPTPRKTCEVCGKTFHILAQYRRHFVYHANERKFECETCGKRFNTLDILRVHNRTHTDERPFTCSECGKTFRTAGCVSRHKRIVHRIHKSQ